MDKFRKPNALPITRYMFGKLSRILSDCAIACAHCCRKSTSSMCPTTNMNVQANSACRHKEIRPVYTWLFGLVLFVFGTIKPTTFVLESYYGPETSLETCWHDSLLGNSQNSKTLWMDHVEINTSPIHNI